MVSRGRSRPTWRILLLGGFFLLMTTGLVVRLAYVQLINHERYLEQANAEHFDKREVRSTRGAILDRNGFPLATSIEVFDLYVDRRAFERNPARAKQTADGLAPLIGDEATALLARLEDDSEGQIELLKTNIDFETGRLIGDLDLPGVTMAEATERFYPEGDLASPLLGFLGRDHSGLAGLEADFDALLAGSPGYLYFERDGGGQPIPFAQSAYQPGESGSDIRLTIDRYIQRLTEEELDFQIAAHGASGGTILVMDPATGAILGMASRPSFQLSQLNLAVPDFAIYRNRAVTDLYEPGSVVKTLTMAAAIDKGLVNPNTTYFDSGFVEKGGYEFQNWDFSAHGTTTMTELLQYSLNTGAIWLSDLIGANDLYDYFEKFGFGASTHSGIGGESTGLVRTNADDDWYLSDLATNSYGQGIAATPLQVISAVSSLINGGNLMRPYIVQEVSGAGERRLYEPVVAGRTISPESSATLKEMMHQVVDGVLPHGAKLEAYEAGGKTGTTLVSIPTGYALEATIASFVGFAPVDEPEIIMLVKIDEPKDDPLGGVVAAPVFRKLAPKILAYLNVQPDRPLARAGQ